MMAFGFEFQPDRPAPLENVPTIPVEQPKAELRDILESPSRKALLEALAELDKRKFKLVDTLTKKNTPFSPAVEYPEDEQHIRGKFRTKEEAEKEADRLNSHPHLAHYDPDVKRFQVRDTDPLDIN